MYKINRAFAKPLSLGILEPEINDLIRVLKDVMNPLQVILFGSAVTGPFYEDSDFDLLIVFESGDQAKCSWRNFSKIRRASKRSLDIVPMSKDEFDRKKNTGGIAMVAFNEGRRLI